MEVTGAGGTNVSMPVQASRLAGGRSGAAGGQAAGGVGKAGATGGGGSANQTTSYDKKDTNKDGVVSAIEELTYDLKHPVATNGSVIDVMA